MAGAALVALVLIYVLRSDPSSAAIGRDAGQLSGTEGKAVAAAATESANLLSFRRAHFAADFARALNGTTGSLHKDVATEKAKTLSAMQAGKLDLSAKVLHQALEGPTDNGKGYLVLVSVNAYRSTSAATPVLQNLEVTVVQVKGQWLASAVTAVTIQ